MLTAPIATSARSRHPQEFEPPRPRVGGLPRFVVGGRSAIAGVIRPRRFHDPAIACHVARVLQQAGFDVVVSVAERNAGDAADSGGERHE